MKSPFRVPGSHPSILPGLRVTALLSVLAFPCVFSSGCATTADYQNRVMTWEGKDADTLLKVWGQPDATERMANGDKVFVYSRLRHEPYAYNETPRNIASASDSSPPRSIYVKCATYFRVGDEGKVFSVMFVGDECKWKD